MGLEEILNQRLHWQISFIVLEGASRLLFAACFRAKKENKAKTGLINKSFEVGDTLSNDFNIDFFKESDLNNLSKEDNNYQEDEANGFLNKKTQVSQIDIDNTLKLKKKLIRIFAGKIIIFK